MWGHKNGKVIRIGFRAGVALIGFAVLIPAAMGYLHQYRAGELLTPAIEAFLSSKLSPSVCNYPPHELPNLDEDLRQAIDHLQESLNFKPKDLDRLLMLGRAYCLAGRYTDAEKAFLEYNQAKPKNPLGHIELGFTYETICRMNSPNAVHASAESSEGIETIWLCDDAGIRRQIESEWTAAGLSSQDFIDLAIYARKEALYDDAIEWYRRAQDLGVSVESDIRFIEYLQFRGTGDQTQALEMLEEATDVSDHWADSESQFLAWFRRGVILRENQNHEEAEKVLLKAISLYPNLPSLQNTLSEAYRYLGLTEWSLGKLAEASKNLETAIELNPQNLWAHNHYAKVLYLYDPSRIDEVRREFDLVLELTDDYSMIWINLYEYWMWVGQPQEVTRLCKQALDDKIQDPNIAQRCATSP